MKNTIKKKRKMRVFRGDSGGEGGAIHLVSTTFWMRCGTESAQAVTLRVSSTTCTAAVTLPFRSTIGKSSGRSAVVGRAISALTEGRQGISCQDVVLLTGGAIFSVVAQLV